MTCSSASLLEDFADGDSGAEHVAMELRAPAPGRARLVVYKDHACAACLLFEAVVEQAIETAARMLGSDKSRGYCLEMICADFLAGANLDNENHRVLHQRNRIQLHH